MTKTKQVGIFGGSFDPIHFGHLNLAINMMEACDLDEVLFIPASVSPFKEHAPPLVSAEHRLAMLKLAIAPIQHFRIIDWELHNQGASYTIDTVRKLTADQSIHCHLLIGEDHLTSFHRWKEADELIRLSPPLIAAREAAPQHALIPALMQETLRKVRIPLFDISSTEIRERLSQKKYCGHLVPASVLDYIQQHHLYSSPI